MINKPVTCHDKPMTKYKMVLGVKWKINYIFLTKLRTFSMKLDDKAEEGG